jgi:hypothetical protein
LAAADTQDDPSVALKLIYVTLSNFVGWLVLRARSDACEVPTTVPRHLISAFAASRPTSQSPFIVRAAGSPDVASRLAY